MEGIKVNEARGPTTCAYCHDELDADHVLCGSCGGGLHRDCREALGRCATLGCGGDTARAAAPTVVHVERPPEPTRAPEPARTLGAGRRRYPPRYSSRLQFLRVVLPLLLLGGAFLVVAVAAGTDLSCIAVCLAAISIPAVVMNYVEWSRVRGVDALLARDAPGRVHLHVVRHRTPMGHFEVEVRFSRTGRPVADARLVIGAEVPRWLTELHARVPVRLHGELKRDAVVVIEGPRGELLLATVLAASEARPPVRWPREG